MKKHIITAIETVNDGHKSPYRFAFCDSVRSASLKNALLYMSANKVTADDAVAVLDLTVFKTGEEGCLFAGDFMYFTRLQKGIDLKNVAKTEGDKKLLTFIFRSGARLEVKQGKTAAYVSDVVNEVIRLREGGAPKEKKTEHEPDVVVVQKPKNNPFSLKL